MSIMHFIMGQRKYRRRRHFIGEGPHHHRPSGHSDVNCRSQKCCTNCNIFSLALHITCTCYPRTDPQSMALGLGLLDCRTELRHVRTQSSLNTRTRFSVVFAGCSGLCVYPQLRTIFSNPRLFLELAQVIKLHWVLPCSMATITIFSRARGQEGQFSLPG